MIRRDVCVRVTRVRACVRVCSDQAGLHVVTLNAEILPKAQNCWMTTCALYSHAKHTSVTLLQQNKPSPRITHIPRTRNRRSRAGGCQTPQQHLRKRASKTQPRASSSGGGGVCSQVATRTAEREEDGHEHGEARGGPQADGQSSAAAEWGVTKRACFRGRQRGGGGGGEGEGEGGREARAHLVMPEMIVAMVRRENRRPTMRNVPAGLLWVRQLKSCRWLPCSRDARANSCSGGLTSHFGDGLEGRGVIERVGAGAGKQHGGQGTEACALLKPTLTSKKCGGNLSL